MVSLIKIDDDDDDDARRHLKKWQRHDNLAVTLNDATPWCILLKDLMFHREIMGLCLADHMEKIPLCLYIIKAI